MAASDEFFAERENLIKPGTPDFSPATFGHKGQGYDGWAGIFLRPPESHEASIAVYKSRARAKIEAQGYHIIANVGDQQSDLALGHAERAFKLPNPFYYLP